MKISKNQRKTTIAILLLFLFNIINITAQNMEKNTFDWQGHRGARGLLPENTIPAFLKALEYKAVTTLELDLAVSKDGILIVSHEPWMSEKICTKPDGSPVTKAEEKSLKIMGLTYEEIKQYDCGSRGNERFPEQVAMKTHKPSLADVVNEVKKYCFMRKLDLPSFNIEIKSEEAYDGVFTPPIEEYAKLVVEEVKQLLPREKVCIQSFDVRPLQIIHEMEPGITLALLVENLSGPKANLERLGFQPDIYSPYYKLLRKKHIKSLHKKGTRVIPWTVNNPKAMKKLIRKGVDGIITDYPNLIEAM